MEGYNNTIKVSSAKAYEELMKRLNKRKDVWDIRTENIGGIIFVNYKSSLPE